MRDTCSLAYRVDRSRLLRSVRLVLHLVRRMNQRFLTIAEKLQYEFAVRQADLARAALR